MPTGGRWFTKRSGAIRGGGLVGQQDLLDQQEQAQKQVQAEGSRKRARSSSIASDTLDQIEEDTPFKQDPPKRIKKGDDAKTSKAKSKKKVSEFVATIEWPNHFKELEKVFKALNTVYTFCQMRRHLATTLENLKASVEGLLKRRPLDIKDIAQIKSLMPKLIKFAYVSPETLEVHLQGAGNGKGKGKGKEVVADEYAEAAAALEDNSPKPKEHLLHFQFNDGELRSVNKGGKVMRKWSRKQKDGSFQPMDITPTFSAQGMTKMIERRNDNFTLAVDELLVASAAQGQDAVELLLAATAENVPVKPEEAQGVKSFSERRDDLAYFIANPNNRPSIAQILDDIQDEEFYEGQIVTNGHRVVDAREAVYGILDTPLSQNVADALYATKRISQLYSHQAEAINHLMKGRHVIVSTSTSSGKSLIYQLPALATFEADSRSTAMYIFPTKALAQDQKRSLIEILGECNGLEKIKVATFDGDTPKEDRNYIRDNANVIFTNPDMLHITIMPKEEEWRRFFQNLKIVVVDELHMYNGLFGCHVSYIMRRLRRICAAVGNRRVKFVSCSATVANPARHMETVFGIENVYVVNVDGSPSGRKEHVVWNPPFIDKTNVVQGRVHTITEASRVFRFLMDRGIRAIVFCKIRKICELLMKQVRQDLAAEGRTDMVHRVMAYRSGYSAEDRRKIEQEMFAGRLLGIVATTALELGIDIGSLDAVVTVGFPYTLAGLRQQAGRAGRRNKDCLSMLICDPWPLDQHYAKSPDELYSQPEAEMSLDLENEIVLEGHLQCAAMEMPVKPIDDEPFFGPSLRKMCADRLVADDEGFFHTHAKYLPFPAKHVPIRNTEDDHYSIIDITDGRYKIIEEEEYSRALFEIYEGGIFMHQGSSYIVKEVDHEARTAKVAAANVSWSTKQRDFTDVDAVEAYRIREIRNSTCRAYYGRIKITSIVFGFFKVDRRNNILDTVDIDQPPYSRETHGLWLDVPRVALEILHEKNIHPAASIHAAEHALLSLTPIFVMSVQGDIRTECKPPEKEFIRKASKRIRPARLVLYDTSGKSGGICVKAFDRVNDLLNQALDTIIGCPCADGCPSCVSSTVCREGNIVLAKLGALIVLSCIAGRTIDIDAIPVQPDMDRIPPADTIEVVPPVRAAEHVRILSENGTPLPTARIEQTRAELYPATQPDFEFATQPNGGFLLV